MGRKVQRGSVGKVPLCPCILLGAWHHVWHGAMGTADLSVGHEKTTKKHLAIYI